MLEREVYKVPSVIEEQFRICWEKAVKPEPLAARLKDSAFNLALGIIVKSLEMAAEATLEVAEFLGRFSRKPRDGFGSDL